MCGRFSFSKPNKAKIIERYHLKEINGELYPETNISPTQGVLAICNDEPEYLKRIRWGLIPSWVKSLEDAGKYSMHNARAEEIMDKRSYKSLIKSKRCLILADSFYEWKEVAPRKKQPFQISVKGGKQFAFAGIWTEWENEIQKIRSCSIITTSANKTLHPIHHRMPVILNPKEELDWLSEISLEKVLQMCDQLADSMTIVKPVTKVE